jgi:glycosyltransferase involved in cell wall biosynthesis
LKKRIAYLSRFDHDEALERAIARDEHPRPEHWTLVTRQGAVLFARGMVGAAGAPSPALPLASRLPRLTAAARFFEQAHDNYDILVASGEDVGLAAAMMAHARQSEIPIFIITHGFIFHEEPALAMVRRMANVHFLCLTEWVRSSLESRFGIPRERLSCTGWPIDTEFFRPLARTPGVRPLIVSAGTASRDYGTLVRAVRDCPVDVYIAADSAWFAEPLDISRNDLPAHVRVASCGAYTRLRQLYADASFVVVPIYPTPPPCGTSVIGEAMAMGRAVVATHSESSNDFVVDGETGFHVRPGEPHDLRAAIDTLVANPALAERMGAAARVRALRVFSHDAFTGRLSAAIGLNGQPPLLG